jgi:hypothetical protein
MLCHLVTLQIYAWHRHRTDGLVKSGAIIPYLEGDQFWMAVRRGDETFIEYLETPFDYHSDDATFTVFMDAMLSGVTDEDGKLDGLPYLAGRTVQVMQNGSYLGEFEVNEAGRVLDSRIRDQSYVVAGLGYEAVCQPMRINYPMRNGQGVNFKKRVLSVILRCLGSVKGEVRAEYSQPVSALDVEGEYGEWQEILGFPYGAVGGSPPSCRSENVEIPLSGNSDYDGLIRIRQKDPFPLFLVSIAFGIDQGN